MKNVANLKVNFSVYYLHIITRITIRRDKKKRKKIIVGSWLEPGSCLTRARTQTWLILHVLQVVLDQACCYFDIPLPTEIWVRDKHVVDPLRACHRSFASILLILFGPSSQKSRFFLVPFPSPHYLYKIMRGTLRCLLRFWPRGK